MAPIGVATREVEAMWHIVGILEGRVGWTCWCFDVEQTTWSLRGEAGTGVIWNYRWPEKIALGIHRKKSPELWTHQHVRGQAEETIWQRRPLRRGQGGRRKSKRSRCLKPEKEETSWRKEFQLCLMSPLLLGGQIRYDREWPVNKANKSLLETFASRDASEW